MKNFIATLLFAGVFAAGFLNYQHTKAKAEIAELAKNLDPYEQTVNLRRAEFQSLVKAIDLQKKIQTKQSEIAAVQNKERDLKERIAVLTQRRAALASVARQSFVGKVIAELTLRDGRKLAQAKVLRADDSGLSVSLPSGIQKLAPSELPPDIRQNLHYK